MQEVIATLFKYYIIKTKPQLYSFKFYTTLLFEIILMCC